MRLAPLTVLVIGGLLGCSCFSGCSLRSDAPPPRFIEPLLPPAASAVAPATALSVRLGTVTSDELLRLDVVRYVGNAEVLRDPTWRWTTPPAQVLRQRLQLTAGDQGVVLRDRADLPLVSATLLRYGVVENVVEGGAAQEFTVQILLSCRLADGTEQTQVISAQAAFSGALPGTMPQVSGTLLARVANDAWAQVGRWTATPVAAPAPAPAPSPAAPVPAP